MEFVGEGYLGSYVEQAGKWKLASSLLKTMGNIPHYFNKDQLQLYCTCTYFAEIEIRKLYKKFSDINPSVIDPVIGDAHTRLPFEEVETLKELRACPFARRLCEVFCSDRDTGGLNFEDFLDMMSVFSDRAPWNIKATYAFKVFDFDDDNRISAADIECTLLCLTGEDLNESELQSIVKHVLKETDTVHTNYLSFTEFEHMLARAPDFIRLFRILAV